MQKLLFPLTVLLSVQCMAQNTWTKKADFGGVGREGAVCFSIGTKGYAGTGLNDNGNSLADFWEYDPAAGTWTQKADFGGFGKHYAAGFGIGTKGYLGTDGKDFWEYDPGSNKWTRKADFGGESRAGAVGFSIGTKGYIGTGNAGAFGQTSKKDFWEYDPSTDAWTRKADFAGDPRFYAVGFSIGSKGYIGTGTPEGFTEKKDFWEYDPSTNTWMQKADFEGLKRKYATGFGIGAKGYLGTGYGDEFGLYNDFWEYDPSKNTWTKIASVGDRGRLGSFGFSIGAKGYVGTGEYSLIGRKDFWEYTPISVLPLTISGVKTYEKNHGIQIEWTVQQENNVDMYEVERSDGQKFSKIESIQSKGNSTVVTTYNCFDPHPFVGINFYRIKIIDLFSKATYSQVIKMNINNSGAPTITVYPNPVIGSNIILQANNIIAGNYSINLTNKMGQHVATKKIYHPGGSATQTIELPNTFPPGVYQLNLSGNNINMTLEVLKK